MMAMTAREVREARSSIAFELRDHARFVDSYVVTRKLGSGGDGTVYLWKHKHTDLLVAVKTSNQSGSSLDLGLMKEAKNIEALGKHTHVVEMLAYSLNHLPRSPAIFLEFAPFGDLSGYRARVFGQQMEQREAEHIPEATICKLLRDMSLALELLHGKKFLHTDLKPDNILVCAPDGWTAEDGIPVLPVFKLTDFSRMVSFPLGIRVAREHNGGTPEFSPPLSEREDLCPSGDMWSLGCTIQTFALGILPTQSKEAFIADREAAGKSHPELNDSKAWADEEWRKLVPNLYRPLSATWDELVQNWDVESSQVEVRPDQPYSGHINAWYMALWDTDKNTRITAKALVEYFIPTIDSDIELAEAQDLAEASFRTARNLRAVSSFW
ncbi:putative Serine threonine- kinase ATG1 [Pyrenophora seminiperda CCB06]|uniref:Putative Serine threonine-kinase ATG1 n=1 Tax=Pyrenophora seminiperda CCB06 TaxID=1302712 RepID=A0A3M7MIR5_9PLEO|nr:putative Serine threonine- kinase ATG1 [Pyrenophora seminiperda CCB06]